MSVKTLVLCWKEPSKKEWIPIGKLKFEKDQYYFSYTNGVKKAQESSAFSFLEQMNDPSSIYVSNELFPFLKNRLLPKSRPEYKSYLNWLDLPEDLTEFEELARTNGIKATDSFQLFEVPTLTQEKYLIYFFSHGIRYLPPTYAERINTLKENERLYLMEDIQNEFDKYALLMRTQDPVELVGYCPRVYSQDITKLLESNGADNVKVTIHKINPIAPAQLKLLCKLEAKWPKNFVAFDCDEFQAYTPN